MRKPNVSEVATLLAPFSQSPMIRAHCGHVELIHCTVYALIARWVSGNYPII